MTSDSNSASEFGMYALADAVMRPQSAIPNTSSSPLTQEEAGAAEELLALASEASLSSPIDRDSSSPSLSSLDNSADFSENVEGTQFLPSSPSNMRGESKIPGYGRAFGQARHTCNNCGVTSTPFWRRAADGQYYCNACGLYLRTHNAMRPLTLTSNRENRRNKQRPDNCANCSANETPMWRKSGDGQTVCNACGLYWKLHGHHRNVKERILKKRQLLQHKQHEVERKAAASKSKRDLLAPSSPLSTTEEKLTAILLPKYSLDNAHHLYIPEAKSNNQHQPSSTANTNASGSTSLPITVSKELLDARKLAYMKYPQLRPVNIAPKSSPELVSSPTYHSSSSMNTSPNLMPPLLNNFIQALASPAIESNLPGFEHPLQPLLTSIVSEKLAQQKLKRSQQASPLLQQQQLQYQQQYQQPMPNHAMGNSISNPNWNALFLATQHPYYAAVIANHENALATTSLARTPTPQLPDLPAPIIWNDPNTANFFISNSPVTSSNGQPVLPDFSRLAMIPRFSPQLDPSQFLMYSGEVDLNAFVHINAQASTPPEGSNDQNCITTTTANNVADGMNSNFPRPLPPRALSPFSASGIRFDRNFYDFINMQYWPDPNNSPNNISLNSSASPPPSNHDDNSNGQDNSSNGDSPSY